MIMNAHERMLVEGWEGIVIRWIGSYSFLQIEQLSNLKKLHVMAAEAYINSFALPPAVESLHLHGVRCNSLTLCTSLKNVICSIVMPARFFFRTHTDLEVLEIKGDYFSIPFYLSQKN